jgi:hypothetical protein
MAMFIANLTQYMDDALTIGIKPILVAPLTRRQRDKDNPGKIKFSFEPHAENVRKIAAEKMFRWWICTRAALNWSKKLAVKNFRYLQF